MTEPDGYGDVIHDATGDAIDPKAHNLRRLLRSMVLGVSSVYSGVLPIPGRSR